MASVSILWGWFESQKMADFFKRFMTPGQGRGNPKSCLKKGRYNDSNFGEVGEGGETFYFWLKQQV